jgi:hypothetical protein
MKKVIFAFTLVFVGSVLMSQSVDDYIEIQRSVLKTEKKAAIAEVMQFTEAESEVFWPLYNEYNEKMYATQTKRVNLIKDFAENFDTMTDEKADEIWKEYLKYKKELLRLTESYYEKFKKILPAGKVAKYFQAENKISVLVDFALAAEIPFIETN